LTARMLRDHNAMSRDEARVFADRLSLPEQAHATQSLYRNYLRSVAVAPLGMPWDDVRLTTPAVLLIGDEEPAMPRQVTVPRSGMADDLRVEVVEDCGHFIPDQLPQLVADRAVEHFAVRAPH
jgi:pimeloyl-ACP methyl ester carboxylesterase